MPDATVGKTEHPWDHVIAVLKDREPTGWLTLDLDCTAVHDWWDCEVGDQESVFVDGNEFVIHIVGTSHASGWIVRVEVEPIFEPKWPRRERE